MEGLDEGLMANIVIFGLSTDVSTTMDTEEHHVGLDFAAVNVIGSYDANRLRSGLEFGGADARREGIRSIALGGGLAHGDHIPCGLRW